MTITLDQLIADIGAANGVNALMISGFAMTAANPASASMTTAAGLAYILDSSGCAQRVATTAHAFTYTLSADTYDCLGLDGSYWQGVVANGAPAPTPPTGYTYLHLVSCDASGVLYVSRMMTEWPYTQWKANRPGAGGATQSGHVAMLADASINLCADDFYLTSCDPTTVPGASSLDINPTITLQRIVPGRVPLDGDLGGIIMFNAETRHVVGGVNVPAGLANYNSIAQQTTDPDASGTASQLLFQTVSPGGEPSPRIIIGQGLFAGGPAGFSADPGQGRIAAIDGGHLP